jgi:hypothetical protein
VSRFSSSTSGAVFHLTAVAACVLAARLWLIQTWGSPLPYWDQWDAEALGLYRPWLLGTFEWSQLFAPHNEHRIALTRLADLALFVWSGEWRPGDQLILNAVLHTLIATGIAVVFIRWLRPGWARAAWTGFIIFLFALPAGWQNALWGFQSQVYFANLLALAAMVGLVLAPAPFVADSPEAVPPVAGVADAGPSVIVPPVAGVGDAGPSVTVPPVAGVGDAGPSVTVPPVAGVGDAGPSVTVPPVAGVGDAGPPQRSGVSDSGYSNAGSRGGLRRAGWWLALIAGILAPFGNAGGLLALPAAAIGLVVATLARGRIAQEETENPKLPARSAAPQATSGPVPVSRSSASAERADQNGHIRLRRHKTKSSSGNLVGLLSLLRPFCPVLIVVTATVITVWLLRVDVPGHAYLKAKSATQFLRVLGHTLAWPGMQHAALALVMQAPLVLWLIVAWRRRLFTRVDAAAVGLVAWALLQAAAIAYSRGAGLPEDRPLSRYHDPLLLGLAAQAYCALRLALELARTGRLLALGWTALFAVGALGLTTTNLSLHLPYKRATDAAATEMLRDYFATDNADLLRNASMLHPNARTLHEALNDPVLRRVLPDFLPHTFTPSR